MILRRDKKSVLLLGGMIDWTFTGVVLSGFIMEGLTAGPVWLAIMALPYPLANWCRVVAVISTELHHGLFFWPGRIPRDDVEEALEGEVYWIRGHLVKGVVVRRRSGEVVPLNASAKLGEARRREWIRQINDWAAADS